MTQAPGDTGSHCCGHVGSPGRSLPGCGRPHLCPRRKLWVCWKAGSPGHGVRDGFWGSASHGIFVVRIGRAHLLQPRIDDHGALEAKARGGARAGVWAERVPPPRVSPTTAAPVAGPPTCSAAPWTLGPEPALVKGLHPTCGRRRGPDGRGRAGSSVAATP